MDRQVLSALVLCLACAAGRAQHAPAPALARRTELIETLAGLRGAGPEERAAGRERLSALADAAAPTLVEALALPEAFADGGPGLDGAAEELLVEALRERPPVEVVPVLHEILRRDLPFESQRRLIRVTGFLGDASSTGPLLALVAAMEPARRQLRAIQRELEASLAQILSRHPQGSGPLAVSCEELEPLLQVTVARAIGAAGDGSGLVGLERMLGRAPEVDRAVLEAVGRLDPSDPECLRDCAGLLAWHLTSSDPEARRFAAASLGSQGGVEQVDGLMALLDDPEPRVQRAAQYALGRIAGPELGADAVVWSAWFRRERAWYRDAAPALLEEAVAGEPARAFDALRELSEHTLFRRELALCMAPALEHREAELARAACGALARLGGPAAVAPLEAALADERAEVARAAEQALQAIARG